MDRGLGRRRDGGHRHWNEAEHRTRVGNDGVLLVLEVLHQRARFADRTDKMRGDRIEEQLFLDPNCLRTRTRALRRAGHGFELYSNINYIRVRSFIRNGAPFINQTK